MKRAVAILLPCLLGACSAWPSGSYVQSVSPTDATALAPAIADYLAGALPSGSSITLAPAQKDDPISSILTADLDRDGIIQAATGLPVRYVVAPLDNGLMLRISVADREGASRYFARATNGALQASGPLTVAMP